MYREEENGERVVVSCELLNPGELEDAALNLLAILLSGTYAENQ